MGNKGKLMKKFIFCDQVVVHRRIFLIFTPKDSVKGVAQLSLWDSFRELQTSDKPDTFPGGRVN